MCWLYGPVPRNCAAAELRNSGRNDQCVYGQFNGCRRLPRVWNPPATWLLLLLLLLQLAHYATGEQLAGGLACGGDGRPVSVQPAGSQEREPVCIRHIALEKLTRAAGVLLAAAAAAA